MSRAFAHSLHPHSHHNHCFLYRPWQVSDTAPLDVPGSRNDLGWGGVEWAVGPWRNEILDLPRDPGAAPGKAEGLGNGIFEEFVFGDEDFLRILGVWLEIQGAEKRPPNSPKCLIYMQGIGLEKRIP